MHCVITFITFYVFIQKILLAKIWKFIVVGILNIRKDQGGLSVLWIVNQILRTLTTL